MKRNEDLLIMLALVILTLCCSCSRNGAESREDPDNRPTVPVASLDNTIWHGTWESESGVNGELQVTFRKDGSALVQATGSTCIETTLGTWRYEIRGEDTFGTLELDIEGLGERWVIDGAAYDDKITATYEVLEGDCAGDKGEIRAFLSGLLVAQESPEIQQVGTLYHIDADGEMTEKPVFGVVMQ